MIGALSSKGILPPDQSIEMEVRPEGERLHHQHFARVDQGGELVPETQLSHGYRSIIAWIADVLGQFAWEAETPLGESFIETNSLEEVHALEGLVLVDDIDLYLYPRWQLTVIDSIRALFPGFSSWRRRTHR